MNLSNYPPGVTGNEPQIAGYDATEEVRECPVCGEETEGWLSAMRGLVATWTCFECDHEDEIDYAMDVAEDQADCERDQVIEEEK